MVSKSAFHATALELDAKWLRGLADAFDAADPEENDIIVRLAAISARLDNLAQEVTKPNDFERGVIEGERRVYARSNMLTSHEVTADAGKTLLAAMSKVEIKKIPQGVMALDPLAPKGKPRPNKTLAGPVVSAESLKIELDLSDLF